MDKAKIAFLKGYRISDSGRIFNKKNEEINGTIGNCGYKVLSFRMRNLEYKITIHRLLAYQKYGDLMFNEGIVVRHKDGNQLNNSFDNIIIGTQSENRMDIPEHIRFSLALHAASFLKKYDHEEVIVFHKANGNSYKKTMENFGIQSKGTLHFILKKSNVKKNLMNNHQVDL